MDTNRPMLKTQTSTPSMSLTWPLPPLPRTQKQLLTIDVLSEDKKAVTITFLHHNLFISTAHLFLSL